MSFYIYVTVVVSERERKGGRIDYFLRASMHYRFALLVVLQKEKSIASVLVKFFVCRNSSCYCYADLCPCTVQYTVDNSCYYYVTMILDLVS
jgi:hypothetical protein